MKKLIMKPGGIRPPKKHENEAPAHRADSMFLDKDTRKKI